MEGTGSAYGFSRLTELGGSIEQSAVERDAAQYEPLCTT